MVRDPLDPKGVIREAYRIDGIGEGECRSIFLDWALSISGEDDIQQVLTELLARHAPDHPEHPMTEVLRAGTKPAASARRRGGWRGRTRES